MKKTDIDFLYTEVLKNSNITVEQLKDKTKFKIKKLDKIIVSDEFKKAVATDEIFEEATILNDDINDDIVFKKQELKDEADLYQKGLDDEAEKQRVDAENAEKQKILDEKQAIKNRKISFLD